VLFVPFVANFFLLWFLPFVDYSKISGHENVITVFIMPLGGRTLWPAALRIISL
jgi:hypothetical protein